MIVYSIAVYVYEYKNCVCNFFSSLAYTPLLPILKIGEKNAVFQTGLIQIKCVMYKFSKNIKKCPLTVSTQHTHTNIFAQKACMSKTRWKIKNIPSIYEWNFIAHLINLFIQESEAKEEEKKIYGKKVIIKRKKKLMRRHKKNDRFSDILYYSVS